MDLTGIEIFGFDVPNIIFDITTKFDPVMHCNMVDLQELQQAESMWDIIFNEIYTEAFDKAYRTKGSFILPKSIYSKLRALSSIRRGIHRDHELINLFDRLVSMYDTDTQLLMLFVDHLLDFGDFQRARDLLAINIKFKSSDASKIDRLVRLLFETGEMKQCIDAAEAALNALPSGQRYVNLIILFFYVDSYNDIERVIKSIPYKSRKMAYSIAVDLKRYIDSQSFDSVLELMRRGLSDDDLQAIYGGSRSYKRADANSVSLVKRLHI
ncbi:hypothetical protein [Aureimonas ureilytica]|nr:hypothetical protein [Aureimonas ureilytica]